MSPEEVNAGLAAGKIGVKEFLADLVSSFGYLAGSKKVFKGEVLCHILYCGSEL